MTFTLCQTPVSCASVAPRMPSSTPQSSDLSLGPRWATHGRYPFLLAKLLLVGAILLLGWRLFAYVGTVLQPVLVSLLIAYVLDPLIDKFEARRINRSLAILFVVICVLFAVSLFALVIVPTFVEQVHGVIERLPTWLERFHDSTAALAEEYFGYSLEEANLVMRRALTSVQAAALQHLSGAGGSARTVFNALLVPVFVFYFLRDFDTLKLKPLALVPPRWRDFVISRARIVDVAVGRWVRGQIEVASVLAALYGLGLGLVGIKLGVVIGIMAGLLNFIPYVGTATGLALSLLMVLLEFGGWQQLLGVALVFVVVNALDAYLITPRLVGAKVGLSPVLIIIALIVGGAMFGFLGLVIAVPITAAAVVLLEDVGRFVRTTPFWTGINDAPPPTPETR